MTSARPKSQLARRPGRTGARPARGRTRPPAERREAILAAALAEFSARGFAATRLEDVARRAEVAKGTIYLYFRDKETLFQELIRASLSPVVSSLEGVFGGELTMRAAAERMVDLFVREIYGTSRKDVIRLVIVEGGRFPQLAEFYYREVLSRILGAVTALLHRANQRGELRCEAVLRFPQLIGAPAMVAILWNGLFEPFAPLDVRAFLTAHLDLLFGESKTS
jgi:AcrR family transcriptional regulator